MMFNSFSYTHWSLVLFTWNVHSCLQLFFSLGCLSRYRTAGTLYIKMPGLPVYFLNGDFGEKYFIFDVVWYSFPLWFCDFCVWSIPRWWRYCLVLSWKHYSLLCLSVIHLRFIAVEAVKQGLKILLPLNPHAGIRLV